MADLQAAGYVASSSVFVLVAAILVMGACDAERGRTGRATALIELLFVSVPLEITIALLAFVWQPA